MEFITPKMFGALGNGLSDDTYAFRQALIASQENGIPLLIEPGCKYLISDYINTDIRYVSNDGEHEPTLVVNIYGSNIATDDQMYAEKCGCIKLATNTSLFYKTRIKGYISNLFVLGERKESIHIFDDCNLSALNIINCRFENIGAFCYDSSLLNICRIENNTFLTCYWFGRSVNKNNSAIDAIIKNNYINGGEALNYNSCFEFHCYNGTIISNNFIDYYRSIYHPKTQDLLCFDGPMSLGNQYQMFKYFYYFEESNINSITFFSVGDSFNHTKPTLTDPVANQKLLDYVPLPFNQNGTTVYPLSCIAYTKETANISISDAKIESNIGTILFIKDTLTNYQYAALNLTVRNRYIFDNENIFITNGYNVYNGGSFNHLNAISTNLIIPYQGNVLPIVSDSLVNGIAAFGVQIRFNGLVLQSSAWYDSQSQTWKYGWLDKQGQEYH